MSTPLTDSINALTAYANEVTGASDTNLSDAVHTLASGYGGSDIITEMAKGNALLYGENIVFNSDVETIGSLAFYAKDIASVLGVNVKLIKAFAFARNTQRQEGNQVSFQFNFPNLEETELYAFGFKNFGNKEVVCHAITVGGSLCEGGTNLPSVKYTRANTIGGDQVYGCNSVTKIIINSTPTTINDKAFRRANNLTDIYVPWSEGEVADAPWGATTATIHYDTTFDANGDPIV